jgi:hypothetical protein
MASELGTSSAAPTPCTARATFSAIADGASAQATEASVNRAKPLRNARLEPNLSPITPADSKKLAKPSV